MEGIRLTYSKGILNRYWMGDGAKRKQNAKEYRAIVWFDRLTPSSAFLVLEDRTEPQWYSEARFFGLHFGTGPRGFACHRG